MTAIAEFSPPPSWDRGAGDVIFIDGDHSAEGVTRDLEFWIRHQHRGTGGRWASA